MEDEIIKIERLSYIGPVYNLEVEEDHSYVVSGLAVHNCLCFKEAVLMSDEQFIDRMRGYLNAGQSWPEMDDYTLAAGAGQQTIINPLLLIGLGAILLRWLDGSQEEVEAVMTGEAAPVEVAA